MLNTHRPMSHLPSLFQKQPANRTVCWQTGQSHRAGWALLVRPVTVVVELVKSYGTGIPPKVLTTFATKPITLIFLVMIATTVLLCAGCQQTQGPNGSFGAAPITQLPGQAPMTGPAMPSLGPFGGSKRVPPPPTGAYGTAAAINATQAGYAPNGITQMSHTDETGVSGGVANAGWVETNTIGAFQAAPSAFQGNSAPVGTSPSDSGTGASIRSGGMPVIDLTGSPPPPGYSPQIPYAPNQNSYPSNQYGSPNYGSPVAARDSNLPGQYPATQLGTSTGWNMNSPPSHNTPPVPPPNYDSNPYASSSTDSYPARTRGLMFGSSVNSNAGIPGSLSNRTPTTNGAPAANQPAFSTADRPLQWQSPVR